MNKKTYGKVLPQGGGTSINAAPLKIGLRLAPLIELPEALRLLDINRFWRWTMSIAANSRLYASDLCNPAWKPAPPATDNPARRTTKRLPLFFRTVKESVLYIKPMWVHIVRLR